MKSIGECGNAPRILNLATRWCGTSSRSGRFTPRERALGSDWLDGHQSQPGRDREEEEVSLPLPVNGTMVVQPLARRFAK